MASIRATNTKPEKQIRCGLHRLGYRYRLNDKLLPGKPDLVFPKYNAVVFVHGCFWHRHECHLFKWPETRMTFWRDKLNGNAERDRRVRKELKASGWRVCVVWECSMKGKRKHSLDELFSRCSAWLTSDATNLEISGR